MKREERLVLIDGHAILHRAYHAFPKNLKTRQGELVNAVYGFTRILLQVIADLEPKYLAVAFDLPAPTFRHKEYLGYQIQRPKMDQELAGQIERVKEVLSALNVPVFAQEGYEADDVIGSLSLQARKEKIETVIVTGDRDIMQLVNATVSVYAPSKGFAEPILYDREKVKNYLGVFPNQVVDYKALVGDSSDNYPGALGIGPKTAVKLISRYKNLENIYQNLDRIEEKNADKLKSGKQAVELSRKLATIVTNVPITLSLKDCLVRDYNHQKAIKLFEGLEFKSLVDKLPAVKREELPEMKIKSKRLKNSGQIPLL